MMPTPDNPALAAGALRDLDRVRNAVAMMTVSPGARLAIEDAAMALELRIKALVGPRREVPPQPAPGTPEQVAAAQADARAWLAGMEAARRADDAPPADAELPS